MAGGHRVRDRRVRILSDAISDATGPRADLVVAGGWANSEAVLAAKLRALGSFRRTTAQEAGARGAALLAGIANGTYASYSELPVPAVDAVHRRPGGAQMTRPANSVTARSVSFPSIRVRHAPGSEPMPLVTTASLIDQARHLREGLAAFNVITLEHAEAVATGAQEAGRPAIMQISENAVRYHKGQLGPLAGAVASVAEQATVPLSVHLDHVENDGPDAAGC